MTDQASSVRLARRWFWALFLLAVLAMGGLYAALGARPSAATGIAVLITSLVLLLSTAQAMRIWLALDRARRRALGDGVAGDSGRSPSGKEPRKMQRLLGAPAEHRSSRRR